MGTKNILTGNKTFISYENASLQVKFWVRSYLEKIFFSFPHPSKGRGIFLVALKFSQVSNWFLSKASPDMLKKMIGFECHIVFYFIIQYSLFPKYELSYQR